jgi:SAM-dependent methyltransferase
MFDRLVMEKFYRNAGKPEDLPWHRDEPDRFLAAAVEKRGRPGRMLDLGCGTGVFSVWAAKRGYEVTGLDLIPRALEMARARGDREGVDVTWVEADLLSWSAPEPFDLVLDSGCLHSLIGGDRRRYREKLLLWLAPGGDYVLGHFGRRSVLDWRPVGPRRRTRRQIVEFFSHELKEIDFEQEVITGVPFPIGPTVLGQGFWFRREGARSDQPRRAKKRISM